MKSQSYVPLLSWNRRIQHGAVGFLKKNFGSLGYSAAPSLLAANKKQTQQQQQQQQQRQQQRQQQHQQP